MRFEELAEYLEENVPKLKRGSTLFINQMPVDIPLGLLLKDSFAGTEIDGEIPGWRRGRFHVAVRAKSYVEAKDLIESALEVMTLREVRIGSVIFKSIRPLNEPTAYQLSVGGNAEFSVNFSAIYGIVAE